MNKTLKKVALLAVLSMAAVGCQKETMVDSQAGVETSGTVYTVRYSVNGVTYTETIIGEQAWADFLQRMLALAEEGYSVTVSNNGTTTQYSMSKEVVTYTTTNKPAAYEWLNKMVAQGYEVTITYNPQTGVYTCIAVR